MKAAMTPLDNHAEIIASRAQLRRIPRRMNRRSIGSRMGARKVARIVSTTAAAIQAVIDEGSKIIVSNLPSDVTEAQIKTLEEAELSPSFGRRRVSLFIAFFFSFLIFHLPTTISTNY
ncbi:hypothetical protein PCK2_000183 [Pneumocystis canis]|nr:hypothetical protein PCK2_000183 [Pneumocystis canis]